jgi:hypothetical protein
MSAILSANWKARMLAESLWEFYNYQLYCTVRADDGTPNRHRIDGVSGPRAIGTIRVFVSIRSNERQQEGLVHELLHANMIPLGYPRFRVKEDACEKWQLAEGITNLADHIVIKPIYLSLDYSAEQFLGATRPLSEREKRVAEDLHRMAGNLTTPDGYLTHVSAYLDSCKIKFEPLYLAEIIVRQRCEGDGANCRFCSNRMANSG